MSYAATITAESTATLTASLNGVYRRGVTDELHSQAMKLSQMGYHVVVPELYRGKLGVEAEEAQHLMDHLDWPAAVADVRNAARYLRHMCVILPFQVIPPACVCHTPAVSR